jgi:hypothetical protein
LASALLIDLKFFWCTALSPFYNSLKTTKLANNSISIILIAEILCSNPALGLAIDWG